MIDRDKQAELRARFNPDGSDLRNLQLRLLEILKFIDKVCQENDIRYWLSSGTCLGAVRHGGFIPWDDDVDIEMTENDYRRFQKVMKSQSNPDYVFQTHKNDKNYFLSFGKVRDLHSFVEEDKGYDASYKYRGCFVDVFHIDKSNSLKLFKIGSWLNFSLVSSANKSKTKRYIFLMLNRLVIPVIGALSKVGSKGTYRHKAGSFFPGKRYYKDFCQTKRIKFEDAAFPIPAGYDSYLRALFGEYMELPPLQKIQTHSGKYRLFNKDSAQE